MDYKELAHTVVEADKSQGLHLARWGPRRVDGWRSSVLSPKA